MTQKELAEALGISQAAVSKLARRGMPTDSVERASRWRRRHLQTGRMKGIRRDTVSASPPAQPGAAAPPPTAPEDQDLFDPDEDEDETRIRQYREARDRREHYQAEMAQLAYEREIGKLVLASEMVQVVTDAALAIRSGLEALPAQLAPQLMNRTEHQVEALLAQEIERLLETMSRKFGELARGGGMKREPVEMLVMPTTRDDADVIGFHGVPGRLDPVRRLPGESMAALVKRTLHEVRGAGVLLVYPMLKDVDAAQSV